MIVNAELTGEEKHRLLKELLQIRSQGYCITHENRIPGALGMSAPIFDFTGHLIGGLSISGPMERLVPKENLLREELVQTAMLISTKMGYNESVKQGLLK
jgi:IclR family transcriptional regulator, KDG regulon repressor